MTVPLLNHQNYHHLKSSSELENVYVSGSSRWFDARWELDYEGFGRQPSEHAISWGILLPDGSNLLAPQWASLLDAARRLAWSLIVDPREGAVAKATTISSRFYFGLVSLLRWMVLNNYSNFGLIDNEASWEFYDFVIASGKNKSGEKVKSNVLIRNLGILTLIYRQTEALREGGVESMPEAPYDGRSVASIANEASNDEKGWIPPLPDEVAIPLMGAAWQFVNKASVDAINLQALYLDTIRSVRNSRSSNASAWGKVCAVLCDFEFSVSDGENKPWRKKINKLTAMTAERDSCLSPIADLREIVLQVTGACVITLQSVTGIRASEICAIQAGMDGVTGLPQCISLKKSKSGLNELFYLHSQVTKIHDGEFMEWVIGSRPIGSNYLPPAVIAIKTLHELWSPWRSLFGSNALILNFRCGQGVPRNKKGILPIRSYVLLKLTRDFIRYSGCLNFISNVLPTSSGTVDLSSYKTGEALRTHQWRKSFALYVLRSDPRMLPAISQHFKHLSLAMTEQGYIGNDPEMQEAIDSVRRQRTVQFMLEQATGEPAIAGGMAELVREHRGQLRKIIEGVEGEEAFRRMEAWVIEQDLRIWYADHGKCFIGITPGEARCHQIGKSDPWLNPRPNYSHRSPSVCGGCKCFAVDSEHLPFWRERYSTNMVAIKSNEQFGISELRVTVERVKQSAGIIRALGDTLPSIEGDGFVI